MGPTDASEEYGQHGRTTQVRGREREWITSPAGTLQVSPQRGNTPMLVEVPVAQAPPTAPAVLVQQVQVFPFQPAEMVEFIRQIVQATPSFPPEDIINFIRLMVQSIPVVPVSTVTPLATPHVSTESAQRMIAIASTMGANPSIEGQTVIGHEGYQPCLVERDDRRGKRAASQSNASESSAKSKKRKPPRPNLQSVWKTTSGRVPSGPERML